MSSISPKLARRLDFLVQEARSDDAVVDEAVAKTLRCVSNYTTADVAGGSRQIKRANSWMSRAAFDLAMEKGDFSDWHLHTTNEHEYAIKSIWRWARDNAASLTVDSLHTHLAARPQVTVTLRERDALRSIDREPLQPGESRYGLAGIEVGQAAGLWRGSRLDDEVQWKARKPETTRPSRSCAG